MTIYTSGTQAIQGRTVNHDPAPFVCDNGDRTRNGATDDDAYHWMHGHDYEPRPEYDVLDNPILAGLRDEIAEYDDTPSNAADRWLTDYLDSWGTLWTPEQIDHARRVLSKLAALS